MLTLLPRQQPSTIFILHKWKRAEKEYKRGRDREEILAEGIRKPGLRTVERKQEELR